MPEIRMRLRFDRSGNTLLVSRSPAFGQGHYLLPDGARTDRVMP